MYRTNQKSPYSERNNNEKSLIFVGSVKTRINKQNIEEINLGFSREHLELMIKNLNERDWVNISLRQGKQNKYMTIINAIEENPTNE
jgi:hypothetical protein